MDVTVRSRRRLIRWSTVLGTVAVLLLAGFPGGTGTAGTAHAAATDARPVELTLFWLDGCPHCAAEKVFLADLVTQYPSVTIDAYEVSSDADNRARFAAEAERLGFVPNAVPVTIIGARYWVGFDDSVAAEITSVVAATAVPPPSPEASSTPSPGPSTDEAASHVVDVPIIGEVDLESQSLVVATALIGLLDGFNPCSLWVLSLLLALVLHTGSRRRVLAVGGTFLVVTAGLYAVYIAGLYSVLSTIAYTTWIRVGIAVVAAGFGALNVKDYFAFQRGPSLTIDPKRKPGIVKRMRAISKPDRPLVGVLGATVALAVGVSLVETPCTAGFPVVWTNMLTARQVGIAGSVALFGLYMLLFLADELAVFGVAVVTMRAAKVQEKHGRVLKLIGGVVMLTLAGTMILAPDMLDSVTGTAAIFGGAGLVTALVVWVSGLVSRSLARRRRPPLRPHPRPH